jgi:hypothetical protein
MPQLHDLERIGEVIRRLVEQDIAESSADDHADHAVKKQIVDVA